VPLRAAPVARTSGRWLVAVRGALGRDVPAPAPAAPAAEPAGRADDVAGGTVGAR